MLLSAILRGWIVGMLASMLPGPIWVLCIQRTISKTQKSGFMSGLGASVADTIYAMIAFFSLSLVLGFVDKHTMIITIIGGLIIAAIGAKIFLSNPIVQIRRNRAGKSNLWQDFLSVFGIAIANPIYIFFFIFLFAAFGVSHDSLGMFNGTLMIAGVFLGSASWWFALTFLVSLLRDKFRPRHLLYINRWSGAIITILGLGAILLMFLNIPIDEVLS